MTTTCETPLFGPPPDYIKVCGEPAVDQWDGRQHCQKHLIEVARVSTGHPDRCRAVDPEKAGDRFGCYAHHICSCLGGHLGRHHCYCETRWGAPQKRRHHHGDPATGQLLWLCLPIVLVSAAGKVALAWLKTKLPSRRVVRSRRCLWCGWRFSWEPGDVRYL